MFARQSLMANNLWLFFAKQSITYKILIVTTTANQQLPIWVILCKIPIFGYITLVKSVWFQIMPQQNIYKLRSIAME